MKIRPKHILISLKNGKSVHLFFKTTGLIFPNWHPGDFIMISNTQHRLCIMFCFFAFLSMGLGGCSKPMVKNMEVTAYCGCGKCCNWERGSWKYLKLDFWNRYISKGRLKGKPYSGLTAAGTHPREPSPGLFSADSIKRPWMIPFRIIFPWLLFSKDGTVAADTRYYPFGTRFYIPGYGYAVVEDRGGAIKGDQRLDVFFDSHENALEWGRRRVSCRIIP
jgi:hypothetical protein